MITVFELSDFDGTNGFVINDLNAGDVAILENASFAAPHASNISFNQGTN